MPAASTLPALEALLGLLAPRRKSSEWTVTRIGWMLYAATAGSSEGEALYASYAGRSVASKLWRQCDRRPADAPRMGEGLLHNWAREDDPVGYRRWRSEHRPDPPAPDLSDYWDVDELPDVV